MASGIIDFGAERERHQEFVGREALLSELLAHLTAPGPAWVLVKGSPGTGKSALLAQCLGRLEQDTGRAVPHHFLRRNYANSDRPEHVVANLSARVASLHPEAEAAIGDAGLLPVLQCAAEKSLVPRGERLVLIIDGLDEAAARATGDNPLPLMLPYALPANIVVLCSSRPTYPHLAWVEQRDHLRAVIDLDSMQYAASNEDLCRRYWEGHAGSLQPPLSPEERDQALRVSSGNILVAVRLREQLGRSPGERRRLPSITAGVAGLLDEFWAGLSLLPSKAFDRAAEGLGLLAAAREALPLATLAEVAGWTAHKAEGFLKATRAFLLEEPEHWAGARAYRPFHESFREYIQGKRGDERMRQHHRQLADTLGAWPVDEKVDPSRRRYAARHAIAHAARAGDGERAAALALDVGYLGAKLAESGTEALEADLAVAAAAAPAARRQDVCAVERAAREESHWLRQAPDALPRQLWNRLRSSGWEAARLGETLAWPDGLPALRLRHAVRLGGGELRTYGHTRGVVACAVTPDSTRIVSASYDKTLKLWDLGTGRLLHMLSGHSGYVSACAVTPDGTRIVSASWDHTLKLWDLGTGRLLNTLSGHSDRVKACAVTLDGTRIVSASHDYTLKLWDLGTGRLLHTLSGHSSNVNDCAVTPDGTRIVSASYDQTLKLWDLGTGRLLHTLSGHSDPVNACAVTPDGTRIVSASHDETLKLWDLGTGRLLHTLSSHSGPGAACDATCDGTRVVSASWDKTVKLRDLGTERLLHTLSGHSSYVYACAVTPDGTRIVSASDDNTLKLWDLGTGRLLHTLSGHSISVNACAVTPDGTRIVSGSSDQTLKLWDVGTGRLLHTLSGHSKSVTACAVTPDGTRIVSGSDDQTLKLWDLGTGRLLHTLSGHSSSVNACAVTPDGTRIVSASWDNTLKLWDVGTGRLLHTLSGHSDPVNACAVTPDGTRIVSASSDKTLMLWDLTTGACLTTLYGAADFNTIAVTASLLCASDRLGNLWILDLHPAPAAAPQPPLRLPALHAALLAASPIPAALAQMVRLHLDQNLHTLALGDNLSDIVFRLLEWSESHGRTADLLAAARAANPTNPLLRAL